MKNNLTKEQVQKIAKLANLDLSDAELTKFTSQLSEVIDYNMDMLNKVNTEKIEPLLNVSGLTNATRNDETEVSLSQNEALQNTKEKHNGFFKVKQILDQS